MENRPDYYSIDMLSVSRLKLFAEYSPRKAWFLAKEKPLETDALITGRYTHAALLEPDTISQEFHLLPSDFNLRSKDNKALWNEILEAGKTPIKYDIQQKVNAMVSRVFESNNAKKLLTGLVEQEFFTKFGNRRRTDDGFREDLSFEPLDFKSKMDVINPEKRFISDYKTTVDARPESFVKEAVTRGYTMQAYVYIENAKRNGIDIDAFYFVAQEKTEPYCLSVVRCSRAMLDIGEAQFLHAMALYRYALKNPDKDWDSLQFGKKSFEYDVPDYLYRKYIDEE